MTKNEIEAQVRALLGTVLGRRVADGEAIEQALEPAWDSLKHMELMFSLEEAFHVTLDPESFAAMTSVHACVEQIQHVLNDTGLKQG